MFEDGDVVFSEQINISAEKTGYYYVLIDANVDRPGGSNGRFDFAYSNRFQDETIPVGITVDSQFEPFFINIQDNVTEISLTARTIFRGPSFRFKGFKLVYAFPDFERTGKTCNEIFDRLYEAEPTPTPSPLPTFAPLPTSTPQPEATPTVTPTPASTDTPTPIVCVGPENRKFDTDEHWTWNDVLWNRSTQEAFFLSGQQREIQQVVSLPAQDAEGDWYVMFLAHFAQGDEQANMYAGTPGQMQEFYVSNNLYTFNIPLGRQQDALDPLIIGRNDDVDVTTRVDNVCVYFKPVTLAKNYSCDEALSLLGVGGGLSGLDSVQPPDDWLDMGGWFSYLSSRLWVYVGRPILCGLWGLFAYLLEVVQSIVDFLTDLSAEYNVSYLTPFMESIEAGWNSTVEFVEEYAAWLVEGVFNMEPFAALFEYIGEFFFEYLYHLVPSVMSALAYVRREDGDLGVSPLTLPATLSDGFDEFSSHVYVGPMSVFKVVVVMGTWAFSVVHIIKMLGRS